MKIVIETKNDAMPLHFVPLKHLFRNSEGAIGIKMNNRVSFWLMDAEGFTVLQPIYAGGDNPIVVDLGEPSFSVE